MQIGFIPCLIFQICMSEKSGALVDMAGGGGNYVAYSQGHYLAHSKAMSRH